MTPEEIGKIHEYLELDPTLPSGLRWRKKRLNIVVGQQAGSLNQSGYYKVKLFGKCYGCHRLVLVLNGILPSGSSNEVDHLDRCPTNNSLSNLRWVTRGQNIANCRVKGEYPWRYAAKANGGRVKSQYVHPKTKQKIHVGTFDDPYEAHLAALAHRLENHWIDQ
jgi:hypothetical protein